MAGKAGGFRGGSPSVRADLFELLGKAVLSGLGASLVLMLVTLALAASAQALPLEPVPMRIDAERVLAPSATEPWSGAPVPRPSLGPAGTGALWAIPEEPIPSNATADPADRATPDREEEPEARIEPAVLAVRVAPALPVSPVVREISPMVARQARAEPESDLQILLGLMALACAGAVAFIGRAGSSTPPVSGRAS